jgi:hypothetical protein
MNDDKLTLYYFDDGLTRSERLEVTNALAADTALAARYTSLCDSLSRMSDEEADPVPSDMMHRFHDTIDRAANRERGAERASSAPVHFWSFFWGAAVSAALAVGIGLGVWFSGAGEIDSGFNEPYVVDVTPQNDVVPVVFQRSIQNYFRESEREISDLSLEAEADRLILILRLIDQNRLFAKAATQNNSPKLARVLRAFEPILVQLAADDIAPEDAEALRAQLAFELNVMLTKMARDSSDGRQTNSERT